MCEMDESEIKSHIDKSLFFLNFLKKLMTPFYVFYFVLIFVTFFNV